MRMVKFHHKNFLLKVHMDLRTEPPALRKNYCLWLFGLDYNTGETEWPHISIVVSHSSNAWSGLCCANVLSENIFTDWFCVFQCFQKTSALARSTTCHHDSLALVQKANQNTRCLLDNQNQVSDECSRFVLLFTRSVFSSRHFNVSLIKKCKKLFK